MVKKHWILGHLNDVIDSLVAGVSVNSGEDDASGNFFILKTSAISKGKLNLSEKKPVLPREVARLKCSLRQETILISRMNTPELVGECAYVPCDDPRIYLPDRIWQTNFKKDVDVSAKWLNYLLSSKKYRSLIQNCATGTSNSMKNISKEQLLGLEILYPSFREQTSIAEALSDVDSLISSLQELIEKKKAIKQGTMQELLTGKKRLPGFNEEWEELNFAESAKLKARIGWQGLTTSEYLQSGYAYLITGTDFHNGRIKWETCHFVDEKRYKQDLNIQIKKHDILLTKDGTIGKVAYISNVQKPTTLNSGVFVIRPAKEDSFDPNFVYHILNSFLFDNFLAKLSAGSTINHLYQKDFVDFTFKAPSELVEQQAIAQVLSDMDSEIEQLEKKLAKYQQIKQGMMQELLTGRIRLIGTDRRGYK